MSTEQPKRRLRKRKPTDYSIFEQDIDASYSDDSPALDEQEEEEVEEEEGVRLPDEGEEDEDDSNSPEPGKTKTRKTNPTGEAARRKEQKLLAQRQKLGEDALKILSERQYPLHAGLSGDVAKLFYLNESDSTPSEHTCFLFQLSPAELIETLNVVDDEGSFVLSFEHLGMIACASQAWWYIFHNRHFGLWLKLLAGRVPLDNDEPEKPMSVKNEQRIINFVTKSLESRKVLRAHVSAYIAYTNLFSVGPCSRCNLHVRLTSPMYKSKDVVPVSSFRLETPQEKLEDSKLITAAMRECNSGLQQMIQRLPDGSLDRTPDWLNIYNLVRSACVNHYRCVGCGHPLEAEICGLPACTLFAACEHAARGGRHFWLSLERDLENVDGNPINNSFKVCQTCGVLDYNQDEEQRDNFPCSNPACFNAKPPRCTCEPCALCQQPDSNCHCAVCLDCGNCRMRRCHNLCTKKCSCDSSE